MIEAEHAHVAGEPIHADAGAALRRHQVEQVVGIVEAALAVDRHLGPELVGDLEQRALEVGRELAGVAAGRATCHPVTLDQDHSARVSRGAKNAVATPAIPAPTIATSAVASASSGRGGPSGRAERSTVSGSAGPRRDYPVGRRQSPPRSAARAASSGMVLVSRAVLPTLGPYHGRRAVLSATTSRPRPEPGGLHREVALLGEVRRRGAAAR